MDYDYSKLRGRIVEKYGTITNFADALGKKKSELSAKLNNTRDITKKEISNWSELLDIKKEDYGAFYFTLKVK